MMFRLKLIHPIYKRSSRVRWDFGKSPLLPTFPSYGIMLKNGVVTRWQKTEHPEPPTNCRNPILYWELFFDSCFLRNCCAITKKPVMILNRLFCELFTSEGFYFFQVIVNHKSGSVSLGAVKKSQFLKGKTEPLFHQC